jgi:TonB-linked SusC/RagA family outer membrane protein
MKFHFHRCVSPAIRPLITKCLWVMRLVPLFLLLASMEVSAGSVAQKISFKGKDVSLLQVFTAVRQQTGYVVFCNQDDLQHLKPVTLEVRDMPLETLLDFCFKDQPLTWHIQNRTIFVSAKPTQEEGVSLSPAPSDFRGHVTDTAGNPLVGATVTVKGTKIILTTDEKGNFKLPAIGKVTLVVSYVGYVPQEYSVNTQGSHASTSYLVSIVLRHGDSPLDAVEVIAYGTDTKRFSVGSSTTVTAKDIEQAPVTNVLAALQGLTPGVTIQPTTGAPGSAVQVQVRGQNSIRPSSSGNLNLTNYDQPLFIVDGVPVAGQNNNLNLFTSLAGGNGNWTTGMNSYAGISPFNSINPRDIESITILKDADATSIYGSEGANGVVLVTTKKGRAGKLTLDLSVNTSVNATARPLQMLNTPDYLALRKEAAANDGITLDPTQASSFPDLLVFDQNKYTDWYHQFFGKTASTTDAHAALSGGSGNTTFIATVGYTNSGFNFPGNFADNRFTFHGGLHHATPDNRFTLDLVSDIGYDANNSSGSLNVLQAYTLPPNLPNLVDPSGNLVWSYDGIDLSQDQPYGYLKQVSFLHTYNNSNSLQMSYRIGGGLSFGISAGYSRMTTDEFSDQPLASMEPSAYAINSADYGNSDKQTINIEPQLHYTHSIGKGLLTALVGGTYKKNIDLSNTQYGDSYGDDNLLGSIDNASTVYAYSNNAYYKYDAVFGRLNYQYNQEYIISLTGRRDGSSNFGPGNQFGNFGSAGLGWIFSQEKGFKSLFPFISYAKLAGNYGTSGTDAIAAYNYQAYWNPNSFTFQGTRTYYPANPYNPDYSWDVKKSWNASLDLGFFHDKLLFNATGYLNRSGNQLVNYPLPSQTGFRQVLENLNATVQNKGLEFTVTSTNISTRNVKWTTNFNISTNRNTLLAFPGLASSSYANVYTIGKSTNDVVGFKYKDVNPQTGLFEFYNSKGVVTSSDLNYGLVAAGGDEQPVVDPVMHYFGGFRNTVSYKGLSLTILFTFADQVAQNYLYQMYQQFPGSMSNQIVQVADRWKKPGDVSAIEKSTTGYGSDAFNDAEYFQISNGGYGDDFFIRLKTLSLTYALPPAFLKRIRMQACRLFCNTENLLTITNYKVGDPETPGTYYSVPLQRTIAVGLSLDF